MLLTPPSGLVNAVNLAPISASAISRGTLAWDGLLQADSNNSNVSVLSNIPFKCSYVQPPGPDEDPRGALFRLARNMLRSSSTGVSGSKSRTSSGNGLLRA